MPVGAIPPNDDELMNLRQEIELQQLFPLAPLVVPAAIKAGQGLLNKGGGGGKGKGKGKGKKKKLMNLEQEVELQNLINRYPYEVFNADLTGYGYPGTLLI